MRLEGMYSTIEEAEQGVKRLRNQGYRHDDITVAMNQKNRDHLDTTIDAEVTTESKKTAKSIWNSIKNFFTMDDSDERKEDDTNIRIPSEYEEDIKGGKIAVFIDEVAEKNETSMEEPEQAADAETMAKTDFSGKNKTQHTEKTPDDERRDQELKENQDKEDTQENDVETDEEMIDDIEKHRNKKFPEDEELDHEISTNHFDEEFDFNKDEDERK